MIGLTNLFYFCRINISSNESNNNDALKYSAPKEPKKNVSVNKPEVVQPQVQAAPSAPSNSTASKVCFLLY